MPDLLKREDVIHFSVRKNLKKDGWTLIAGEYPNGSDDELHSLRVMDPYLARDNSPDHRRHSLNKLVPDLITFKDNEFLIIEMKPKFSKSDEEKLTELLQDRFDDLLMYLDEFIKRYMPDLSVDVRSCKVTPCLGFANSEYEEKEGFLYILVNSLESINIVRK
jgi:hypothetical protein